MTRDELFAGIVDARPALGELIYVERRGQEYGWSRVEVEGPPGDTPSAIGDVWMFYAVQWELDDPERMRPFFDDLLEEMESMVTGTQLDRCRWPLDDPWPHRH